MKNELVVDVNNLQGCFNLIAMTIEKCFVDVMKHTPKDIKENIAFLTNNKIIDIWCDCSDNFTQEKLVKSYYKHLKIHNRI